MSKDGHIGIVSNTNKPISKMGPSQPIIKRNDMGGEGETMEKKTQRLNMSGQNTGY